MKLKLGLALFTFSIMLAELALVSVFDVILTPTMGYVVITSTMFALGIGGIYLYIFPIKKDRVLGILPLLCIAYAISLVILRPLINFLPFDLSLIGRWSLLQILAWTGMYLCLVIPFFVAGLILSTIFSNYSSDIHSLYFFDLIGAGIGCLGVVYLITPYGPGGILFASAGAALLSSVFLLRSHVVKSIILLIAVLVILFPATVTDYLEFSGHSNKRRVDDYISQGLRDYVRWGPVSKLDVLKNRPSALNFALDGGQCGSWLIPFDGNYKPIFEEIRDRPDKIYYGLNSVVHYFMRDKHPEVLIIGAAVGGETRAALFFGAKHIDSIELVEAMVNAAKIRYADYCGNSFNHPRINYRVGEGRAFLRSSGKKYDVIQMFSNRSSSSLADGSGAVRASYLLTSEAFQEYFEHLTPEGIIQINNFIYPRILTSAADGWYKTGRKDFFRYVLVIERRPADNLPTTFIKMKPWTEKEVNKIISYMNRRRGPDVYFSSGPRSYPSERIYANHPFRTNFVSSISKISRLSVLIGTYNQKKLDYNLNLKLFNKDGNLVATASADGNKARDNRPVSFLFPEIVNTKGNPFFLEMSADNPDINKSFSVWLSKKGEALIGSDGKAFRIAFNPLKPESNLIPREFVEHSFPSKLAEKAIYVLRPVTDDNPYFEMIRKTLKRVSPSRSTYLDIGTASILNMQLLPFLSQDWLNLFLVGVISLVFAIVFIFVPLFFSSLGRAKWKGMIWYLVYFSCLGAGFIIVELVFIQIFKKLIGFPTHAFGTVIFSLLFSAGTGSLVSKLWRLNQGRKWIIPFIAILALGVAFILFYPQIIHLFLAQTLIIRILASAVVIFPIGFFMGMAFPFGIHELGIIEAKGIPWAWGMNGFFTVFGGFLSIVLSLFLGFRNVLLVALAIYLLAFLSFSAIKRVNAS